MPVSPAQAFALVNGGNFASCLTLPREQTLQIFCTDEYRTGKGKVNEEAEVAWRFMGTTGIVACTAAVLADKACGAEDKKKLNGALAATSLINVGFFAANGTMKRDVKPAMRALNIAANMGVGAYALKEALGK
mmetsp:Transcript_6466/g.26876  ORF Transcript_6466/g.26876 Transcript_6466/m.26876 type:complete len:133 (-) Transcript_6466:98-496(-)